MKDLAQAAQTVCARAYAPYSKFRVGAAIRAASGQIYTGCNVENIASPEGTCAEAGAIAAMIAGGDTEIVEVFVVSDGPIPVTPCGGCRQKLAEFSAEEVRVVTATLSGLRSETSVGALLPGAFSGAHMDAG